MRGHEMPVVFQPQPQAPRSGRNVTATPFLAISVHDQTIIIEAETGIETVIVEEEQAAARAGVAFDLNLELIAKIPGHKAERAAVAGLLAAAGEVEPSIRDPHARVFVFAGSEEGPV